MLMHGESVSCTAADGKRSPACCVMTILLWPHLLTSPQPAAPDLNDTFTLNVSEQQWPLACHQNFSFCMPHACTMPCSKSKTASLQAEVARTYTAVRRVRFGLRPSAGAGRLEAAGFPAVVPPVRHLVVRLLNPERVWGLDLQHCLHV